MHANYEKLEYFFLQLEKSRFVVVRVILLPINCVWVIIIITGHDSWILTEKKRKSRIYRNVYSTRTYLHTTLFRAPCLLIYQRSQLCSSPFFRFSSSTFCFRHPPEVAVYYFLVCFLLPAAPLLLLVRPLCWSLFALVFGTFYGIKWKIAERQKSTVPFFPALFYSLLFVCHEETTVEEKIEILSNKKSVHSGYCWMLI